MAEEAKIFTPILSVTGEEIRSIYNDIIVKIKNE